MASIIEIVFQVTTVEHESVKERMSEAFAGNEPLTAMGRQLQAGDPAPDFRLDYLDLADLAVHTVGLADSIGMVRLQSAGE